MTATLLLLLGGKVLPGSRLSWSHFVIEFTGRVEEKYEKRHKDEEEKNTHWRQKVDNVCVVLVEEQFGHLE